MEGIANESIHKAIGRIDDEISEIKDLEIELELSKLKKDISRELYKTELDAIRQREERLLSEKRDILAKNNDTHALKHRDSSSKNWKDGNEETQFFRFPRVYECKDENVQAVFCRLCKSFDCYQGGMFNNWNPFLDEHMFDVSFNYPNAWENMKPNENTKVVDLCKGTREYDRILGLLQESAKSLKSVEILEIKQVQNKLLYQQYYARRSYTIPKKRQMQLWHAVTTNCVKHINMYGFDGQISKRNASGKRFLFFVSADEALKCLTFQRKMAIYLCDVIIGNYTTETPSSNDWPENTNPGPDGWQFYDSTVDNVGNPRRFAVYSESQVYPAYYILVNLQDVCVLS